MDAIDPNHLASIPQLVPERVVESSAARIEWQLDADDDRQRLHRIAEYVVDRLGAERNAWGEPALCHGDSHFRNVIVTPKHEAVWIDFEDAWIGPRVYDLATVVWSTLRHRSTRPLWESALRAYARAMPEVRIAARSLGTFMVVRQLWWLTLHASRWDASVPRARRQTFLRQGLVLAEIICRDACGGSCAFPESQPLERGPSDASMRRRGLR
jgi:Ser/Thr protein kinase RdoA (MazF antagonist)